MRRSVLVLVATVLAVVLPAPARGQAGPAAVVVRVTGAVQVQAAANARAVAATPGARLNAGARVIVPPQGRAVILYRTGRPETLTRTTVIRAPRGAARSGVFRETVRTLREVATTDARTQPNRQGMIRPIRGAPVPIEPRNGVLVASTRPRLAWFAVPGAAGYLVQLRRTDAAGGIVRYEVGRDTSFAPGAGDAELARGAEYEWSVAVVPAESGRAAPPQRFRVATRAQVDSLDARLAEIRAAGLDPEGDGLFLAALAYRDAGFLYDARAAIAGLHESGQGLGSEFHALRREVHGALGMEVETRACAGAGQACR